MLELKNIKKSFGGTGVLKNVGLSVAKGDVSPSLVLRVPGRQRSSELPTFLKPLTAAK